MARKASGKAKNSRSRTGSGTKSRRASGARRTTSKAGRAAKASGRRAAKRSSRAASSAKGRAAQKKKADRSRGGGKSATARARAQAGPRSDTGRSRREGQDVSDVTAEVQERYDAEDDDVPTPPSTLNLDRHASAARTGHEQLARRRREHTAATPAISGGDVDADWEQAYFVGDEAATADNPTPDQSEVEGIGRAIGIDYEDNEELKSTAKVARRDRKRWELDPASSEDYPERNRTDRSRKK